MGLGLTLAIVMLLTDGMKNLFGKPRPDMISRCQPDVSNVQDYVVSRYAFGDGFLVSAAICQQTDIGILNDGFRSFPSGHASCKAPTLHPFNYGCRKKANSLLIQTHGPS